MGKQTNTKKQMNVTVEQDNTEFQVGGGGYSFLFIEGHGTLQLEFEWWG